MCSAFVRLLGLTCGLECRRDHSLATVISWGRAVWLRAAARALNERADVLPLET